MKHFNYGCGGLFFFSILPASLAASITVTGGTTAIAPVDVTPYLIANDDIVLSGGYFVVNLPQAGTGVVPASTADPRLNRNGGTSDGKVGYDSPDDPTIVYTGVMSGNGAVSVQSSFNTTQPASTGLFSGGTLMFANQNGQTWGLGTGASGDTNPPALTIGPNATVSFYFPGSHDNPVATAGNNGAPIADAFPSSSTTNRNIVNNGYLYSSASNHWASITGTGLTAFTYWGGDSGSLSSGGVYSGSNFIFENGVTYPAGVKVTTQPNGTATNIVAADITVFRNGPRQYLTVPSSFTVGDPIDEVDMNIYLWGLDIQIITNGINQFNGVLLPPEGSPDYRNSAPFAEAVKSVYSYGPGMNNGFGRPIYLSTESRY